MYAKILKQLGFLSKGDLVPTTASDFIGQYIGQSQTKTSAIIEKARGNVLLIDEAYALDDNLFGKQVLNVIVEKVQGSENDDIAVLLCGYDVPMMAMLRNQNSGLARRFPRDYAFEFHDYSDFELMQLFDFECKKQKVTVASHLVKRQAIEALAKQRQMPNFGNAGAVNLLVRSAISKASVRQVADSELCLTLEDFGVQVENVDRKDPIEMLNSLYRIETVKSSLIDLRNAYIVAEKEGSKLPNVTNFVFTGSPGTGKTTVARVMAQILYEMGILSTNILVETSGLGLTGEFIGHTKKRVEVKLGEARGGVLFIDEAYELGKGHFSDEALTSIVAAMTNPIYRGIVIILAGYQKDIDQMLDKNVGMKSRFTRFFHFEEWTPQDCLRFLSDRAEAENFLLDDEVEAYLLPAVQELIELPGWGNGRDVMHMWNESLVKRSSRVIKNPETLQKTVALSDVQVAVEAMLEARRKQSKGIMSQQQPSLPSRIFAPLPPLASPQFTESHQERQGSDIKEIQDEKEDEEELAASDKILKKLLNDLHGSDEVAFSPCLNFA
ncbi:P-loop containing nucleoside triphosphate hydrolase protein [Chytriomyces sp. MP71]|nr:P-loop containing nucleoside triphosphate hydrolase protein [Chytriomyces sp. MP71]